MLKSWKEIPVVAQLQPKMLRKIRDVHSSIKNAFLVIRHNLAVNMNTKFDFDFMYLVKCSGIPNYHTFSKGGCVEIDFRCILGE